MLDRCVPNGDQAVHHVCRKTHGVAWCREMHGIFALDIFLSGKLVLVEVDAAKERIRSCKTSIWLASP